MTNIEVVKSTGEREPLDLEKVRRAVLRAGASAATADKIVKDVESRAYEGIKTQEIYALVRSGLERAHPGAARRYDLRDAIIRLGPAGFDFEKYIAQLLSAYGYKTELPPILEGACITHEVDVVAEKDGRVAMMECKLRQEVRIFITIKDTMSTWMRFLDLLDAARIGKAPHFDECWIVTNSKFSHDSIKFGHCKNMVMLSWDHPRERPLPRWIDEVGLYPITILRDVSPRILTAFSSANIMLLRDLVNLAPGELQERLKLPPKTVKKLIDEAKMVL